MSDARQRWDDFLRKLATRVDEVLVEAKSGLAELIETEVIDPGPVAAASNEVRARLFALHDKIDTSRVKLGDGLTDDDEARGRALEKRIRDEADALEAWTRATAVARLKVLSEAERAARKLTCSKCRAPLEEPAVQHRTETVTCAHCGAVNTVRPGLATATYFALKPKR